MFTRKQVQNCIDELLSVARNPTVYTKTTSIEMLEAFRDSLPQDKWEAPKEWGWFIDFDYSSRNDLLGISTTFFDSKQFAETAAKRRKRQDKLQQYINAHWPEHDVSGRGYSVYKQDNGPWLSEYCPNVGGLEVSVPDKAAKQVCDALNSGELDLGD